MSDPCCDVEDFNGETRYIIGDQDVNFNSHKSSFDIAVSKTSNPTTLTAADWNFYKIDTTEANCDADYPGNFHNTGDALVFTLNMFAVGGTTGTYHTQIVSIPLADLFNGVTTPQVFHNDLADFNLRPIAMHDGPIGGPEYRNRSRSGAGGTGKLVFAQSAKSATSSACLLDRRLLPSRSPH
ncbi:MAG: hypothetical protein JSS02_20545, partial [Planctomycetes bacterium]|nr:hypothetical protein [Planctomycetota bacterium]